MFVLTITIVLEIFLIKDAIFTKQPQQLEMSLMQVNQILADIDRKINTEINLLTKLNKENVQDYRRVANKLPVVKHVPTRKKPSNDTHNPKQSKMEMATTNKQYKVTSKERTNISTHQERKINVEKNLRNIEVKEPESGNEKIRDDVTILKSGNLSDILQQIFPETGVIPFIDRKLILRRRMRKNSKNIAKYNKLIRHFILKHSTLFYTFIKHYEKTQKHGHHKKHKHRHSSGHRHKGNVRQAVDTNSKKGVESSLINKMAKNEGLPKSNDDVAEQTVIPYPDKKEKRDRAEYSVRCSQNDSSTKFKKFTINNTKHFGSFTKNGDMKMQNWTQFLTTTKKIILKNKVLEKIVEESSYSDEELYLKTMLKDAFFHGNATLPSNLPKR